MSANRVRIAGLKKAFDSRLVCDIDHAVFGECSIEGLIGPNGAGKTTLMSLITGKLRPDSGAVVFERDGVDVDITKTALDAVTRAGLVRTNQVIQDFESLTVRDSLLLSSTAARHERFWKLSSERAVRAETKDAIEEYLDYFHFENPKGHALSAGEKKLLDIIRCLLLKPAFLLMDEPTAGLPEEQTALVMELLRQQVTERSMTILLVEHDLDLIWGMSERVHFLSEGQLIATDTPEAIRTNPLVIESYMGATDV